MYTTSKDLFKALLLTNYTSFLTFFVSVAALNILRDSWSFNASSESSKNTISIDGVSWEKPVKGFNRKNNKVTFYKVCDVRFHSYS